MVKTTLYLPDDLKHRLEQVALREGTSEADFIRRALAVAVERTEPPAPRLPLFDSADPTLASRTDEFLEGFGAT